MSGELQRTVVRMASNYVGLFLGLMLSAWLPRLLFHGAEDGGLGLILMLGASIGVSAMLQNIVQQSIIRELSEAYHGSNNDRFILVYNSAMALSALVAILCLAGFAVLIAALSWFNIPPELLSAARWFTAAKAVQTSVVIILAAPFNMYLVSERMVAYNFWRITDRLSYVLAALLLLPWTGLLSNAQWIIAYGWWSSGLYILLLLIACGWMMAMDRRTLPRPWRATRQAARALASVGAWNAAVVTALGMHLRLDAIIINFTFGVAANTLFGLATIVVGWTRMVAAGISLGLEAATARLSIAVGEDSVRQLFYHTTRLSMMILAPTCLIVFLFCPSLVTLWMGDQIQDPQRMQSLVTLIRILVIGSALRGVTNGWTRMLYGAGHIRRYAWVMILGGVFNPVSAILLLLILPEAVRFYAPAWAFTASFVIFEGFILPVVVARCLDLSVWQVYQPMIRPLLITAVVSPITFADRLFEGPQLIELGVMLAVFGCVYALATWCFGFTAQERRRIFDAVQSRLGRAKTVQALAPDHAFTPEDDQPL